MIPCRISILCIKQNRNWGFVRELLIEIDHELWLLFTARVFRMAFFESVLFLAALGCVGIMTSESFVNHAGGGWSKKFSLVISHFKLLRNYALENLALPADRRSLLTIVADIFNRSCLTSAATEDWDFILKCRFLCKLSCLPVSMHYRIFVFLEGLIGILQLPLVFIVLNLEVPLIEVS